MPPPAYPPATTIKSRLRLRAVVSTSAAAVDDADHSCAATVKLDPGNGYTKLECTPQLDEIGYWSVRSKWATLDATPAARRSRSMRR